METQRFIFGSNGKGVDFTQNDFQLLLFIQQHKIVTINQIHTYNSAISNIKRKSLAQKLRKWRRWKLVEYEYFLQGQKGFRLTYYRIGKKGIEISINAELIKRVRKEYKLTKNLVHHFGTQDVVAKMEKELVTMNYPYTSCHPFEKPFYNKEKNTLSNLLIPDWVMETENTILMFELDTRSEGTSEIRVKTENYIKLAQQNIDSNFFVLFISMDDSVRYHKEFGMDKSKRIANMKSAITSIHGWNQESNLRFYVSSSSRAPIIGKNILTGKYPINNQEKDADIDLSIRLWTELNPAFHYEGTRKEKVSYYPNYIESDLFADQHFVLIERKIKSEDHIAFISMEEGSVRTWDRLKYLNLLAREVKFKEKVKYIVALYLLEDELKNDVISEKLEHVRFGHNEMWIEDSGKFQTPRFFRCISPYRKEMCQYGES